MEFVLDGKTIRRMRTRMFIVFLSAFTMPVAFFFPLFLPAIEEGRLHSTEESIVIWIAIAIAAAAILSVFFRIHMNARKHSLLRIDAGGVSLRKYPLEETSVAFDSVIYSAILRDKAGNNVGILLRAPDQDLEIIGFGNVETILTALESYAPDFELTAEETVTDQNEAVLLLTLAALPIASVMAGIGFRRFVGPGWMKLVIIGLPFLVGAYATLHGGYLLLTKAPEPGYRNVAMGFLASRKLRGTIEVSLGLILIYFYLILRR